MTSFRELDVWKCAMDLTDAVYDVVKNFPQDERYALADQLRRAVVSIPSNVAEGFGRESHADFAHFLSQAKGSLYEVDTQLEIAVRRGWIASSDVPRSLMNDISKLLGALSRHLRSTPTPHNAQGTRHKAQSTRHRHSAQSTGIAHKAQGTKHKAPA